MEGKSSATDLWIEYETGEGGLAKVDLDLGNAIAAGVDLTR